MPEEVLNTYSDNWETPRAWRKWRRESGLFHVRVEEIYSSTHECVVEVVEAGHLEKEKNLSIENGGG
jgi:hypothetical protein